MKPTIRHEARAAWADYQLACKLRDTAQGQLLYAEIVLRASQIDLESAKGPQVLERDGSNVNVRFSTWQIVPRAGARRLLPVDIAQAAYDEALRRRNNLIAEFDAAEALMTSTQETFWVANGMATAA